MKNCINRHAIMIITRNETYFIISIDLNRFKTKLQIHKFNFVNVDLIKLEITNIEPSTWTSNWEMTILFQLLYLKRWTISSQAVSQAVSLTTYLQKPYCNGKIISKSLSLKRENWDALFVVFSIGLNEKQKKKLNTECHVVINDQIVRAQNMQKLFSFCQESPINVIFKVCMFWGDDLTCKQWWNKTFFGK